MSRIEQYQRERENVYIAWVEGRIGRDAARVAIRTITKWIENLFTGRMKYE